MKIKILFLSFISILFSMGVIYGTTVWLQNKNEAKYVKDQYIENEHHIKYLINNMKEFYIARAYANMHSEGIKNAVKNRNRSELHRLTLPRYKNMVKENPYLQIMHFHSADGTTLLRMHNRGSFGDNISLSRPMIRDVHKDKKIKASFEIGNSGIAYRINVPIFDKELYIGILEFGIKPEFILSELEKLAHTHTIIYQNATREIQELNHYVEFESIVEKLEKQGDSLSFPTIMNIQGKIYALNKLSFNLYDNNNSNMDIIFSNDITDIRTAKKNISFIIFAMSIVLLIIIWMLQSYGFNILLKKLDFKQRYLRMLIDTQPNLLVISRGGIEAHDSNKSFLKFIGFKDFNSFTKEYACVCDLFRGAELEGYLQKSYDSKTWIEYILANPDKEHKAKMYNTLDEAHIFIVHIKKLKDETDKEIFLIVFDDITELELETKLDSLTKLSNRRNFNVVMEYIVENSQRNHNLNNSIILFDIDHFKLVNDDYGHQRGDDVLVSLAKLVKDLSRDSDVVVRWGGEEFAILLSNTLLNNAILIAEKIRKKIECEKIADLDIRCSFGVTQIKKDDTTTSVLKRVDTALYKAKESGRNCVVSF